MALTITRFDRHRRHGYLVKDDAGNTLAEDLCGITTILGVLDKPGLPIWSAREAGKAIGGQIKAWLATQRLEEEDLDAIATEAIADGYRFAEALKDKAAAKGTDTHTLCEQVALRYKAGQDVSDLSLAEVAKSLEPLEPQALELAIRVRDWFVKTAPSVVGAEKMTVCLLCGYGATLDLECEIDGEPWVIDLKTSSGIYSSMPLQLVGQAHALGMTAMHDAGHEIHAHADDCTVHRLGVLWVNDKAKGGCELVEMRHLQNDYDAFQAVLALWKWQRKNEWNLSNGKKGRR